MVKTRFAPSPTGFLHIGGVRAALIPFAMARKHGGQFLVRIEDTDRKRYVEGAEQKIFDMLKMFDMNWDDSFRQSDRLEIYRKHAEELVTKGGAYYCFATPEEVEAQKKLEGLEGKRKPFRSPYRDLPLGDAKAKIAAGEKYVIRQKLPVGETIQFEDGIQGRMEFNTDEVDEGVLLKSDGFPTYHLASVVDDQLTAITHVFRGVEWLPSVPKHVLLYRDFGWEAPKFFHMALILDPDGGKLSKRKGAVSVEEFLKEGYLPEALLNFMMLLGWSSPLRVEHGEKEREIFSLADLVDLFDTKDLTKHSAVFNREKLLWFNQKYISILSADKFENAFLNWLKQYGNDTELEAEISKRGPDYLQKILELERTRIKLLAEIPALIRFFYFSGEKADFSMIKQTKKLTAEQTKTVLVEFLKILNSQPDDLNLWKHEDWEASVRKLADELGIKAGEAFMVLRIASTDSPFSPPLFEVMQILGKQELKARLERYL